MKSPARSRLVPARLAVSVCTALAACGGGGGGSSLGSTPDPEEVTLVRDAHGVGHVFAASDEGALYGAGYAAAEDRHFQMLWTRLMFQGRVAEFFGPGFQQNPTTGAFENTHVEHDREARLVGWSRHARRVAATLDAETRSLLDAYAQGVNAFLLSPGAALHPFVAQYGLPLDPWTAEDCVGVWLRLGRHFTGAGYEEVAKGHTLEALLADPQVTLPEAIDALVGGRVCDDAAAVVQPHHVAPNAQAALQAWAQARGLDGMGDCPLPLDGPKFSQAWAVAGSRTTTGNAVLVGDPRIEVFVPNMLYEWSMQGATFTVRGLGVAGSPNLLLGSSEHVAWSPTALGLDQADLFELVTDPVGHPGAYRLDGAWRPFEVDEAETILVRGAAPVSVRYRETYWGPVVTPILFDVEPREEFALHRVPLRDPGRDAARAFPRLYRAPGVTEFHQALGDWSWPPVNMVFADDAGRVGYGLVGDAPVRRPELLLPGVVPQDGGTRLSGWLELLPHDLKPHVLDPPEGYVFSANHMPVGSWYPIPMRFGTGGVGDTSRSRRLRELLSGAPALVKPTEVLDPHFDDVHPGRRDLVELAVFLRDRQPGTATSPDFLRALTELEGWWQAGAHMEPAPAGVAHRGVVVAWHLDLSFREDTAGPELIDTYGGSVNGLNLFLKTKIADVRAATAVPLDGHEAAYVEQALARAYVETSKLGGGATWLPWYESQVLAAQLPTWTSLEGFPSLTPGQTLPVGPFRAADPQALFSPFAQSATQWVELGGGDRALAVAPPGQTEAPGGHHLDQVPLWEAELLRLAPATVAGALATGAVTYTDLQYQP